LLTFQSNRLNFRNGINSKINKQAKNMHPAAALV